MIVEQRRGFHPFYLAPLFYVTSLYFFVFSFVQYPDFVQGLIAYLPIGSGLLNLIVSILFCKPQNRILLLNAAVLVKCALIPFFLVGGILVCISFVMSFIPVPFMIFVGPSIGIMLLVIGWVVLVLGAPYAVSYLRLSSKARLRSVGMAVLHGVLQFFFTLDVIDVMVLVWRERKWRRMQNVS